jgi:hypothetical protein
MLCIDDVRTVASPVDPRQPVPEPPAFDPAKSIRLEDEDCLVEVSRSSGSITRLRDKKAGLDLILEPRLAGNFRFAMPIPGKEPWQTIEANWIFGRDRQLSSGRIEGKRLDLRWDGPARNYLGEKFGDSIMMSIELSFVDHAGRPGGQVYEAAPVFLRFLDGGCAEMWEAGAARRASPGPPLRSDPCATEGWTFIPVDAAHLRPAPHVWKLLGAGPSARAEATMSFLPVR